MSSKLPRSISDLIRRVRTRMWLQSQWPDPELLYERGGLLEVAAYLQQCWSPTITRDILRRFGADIHPETWPIGPNITLHEFGQDFSNLHVGAFSHIGREVFIDLSDEVIIEDSVSIGMRAVVLTHLNLGEYPNKPAAKLIPKRRRATVFRQGCSVGAGSVIACGVEIGAHAVVGAGMVVDRDVPPRTILRRAPDASPYEMPARFFRKLKRA